MNRVTNAGAAHRAMRHGRRVSCIAAALAAALLTALAVSASASAALDIKWYSFNDLYCTNRVDPVTTIFYYQAYAPYVNVHIPHHGLWTQDVQYEGSVEPLQRFWDAGYCTPQWGAFASAAAWESSRYHVRFREGHYADATFWYFSLATPHHETRQGCGHVVDPTSGGWSGFDEGRRALANTMAGPHYSFYQYVGNSALMTQCNGALAGSNGEARYTRIDTLNGPT
jgi:hypothetical protein